MRRVLKAKNLVKTQETSQPLRNNAPQVHAAPMARERAGMVKRMGRIMMLIGTVGFLLVTGDPELAPAADKEKSHHKAQSDTRSQSTQTQSL